MFIARLFVGGTIHGAWSTCFVLMNEMSVISKRGIIAGVLSGGTEV